MEEFLIANLDKIQTFIIGWIVFWLVLSVLYQIFNGKRLPDIPAGSVAFRENWTSGRSFKNLFTRLGGARNALSVTIGRN